MTSVIRVSDVGKSFRIPHSEQATLKGRILHPRSRTTFEQFNALDDVSFEVEEGEFFGIIGRNGSGKSTLLKLLAGIYRPDSGSIQVDGTIAPFIELGVGFNPELSGRDNVFINGALLGLSARRLRERYSAIVRFAELERFMDLKLRNFSSGMQVRLAFSIALEAGADILLTDEVLAVGDARFQQKCFDVFRKRKAEGRTVVFVSHDMSAMIDFCDRSLLLDRGRVDMIGDTREVVRRYQHLEATAVTANGDSVEVPESLARLDRAEVAGVTVGDFEEDEVPFVWHGDKIDIAVRARFHDDVEDPIFGLLLRDRLGKVVLVTNTLWLDAPVGARRAGDEIDVTFSVDNPLAAGRYKVTCGIVDGDPNHRLDLRNDIAEFDVRADIATGGVVDVGVRVSVQTADRSRA